MIVNRELLLSASYNGVPLHTLSPAERHRRDTQVLRSLDMCLDEVVIYTELPEVIGTVPLEERAFFTTYTPPGEDSAVDVTLESHEQGFKDIVAGMPRTVALMDEDMAGMEIPARLDAIVLDRVPTMPDEEGPYAPWHIDDQEPWYVISDQPNCTTRTFGGLATFQPVREGAPVSMDPVILIDESRGRIWQPNPFDILRMGRLKVHSKPPFMQTTSRTFGGFQYSLV